MLGVSFVQALSILYIFLALDLLVAGFLIFNRYAKKRGRRYIDHILYHIINESVEEIDKKFLTGTRFLDALVELKQDYSLSGQQEKRLSALIEGYNRHKKYVRYLHSPFAFRRIRGISYLSNMPIGSVKDAMMEQLKIEKKQLVLIYLINGLVELNVPDAIPIMAEKLIGAPERFRGKVVSLICRFEQHFLSYFEGLEEYQKKEIHELLIFHSSQVRSGKGKNYLLQMTDSSDYELKLAAYKALSETYYTELNREPFFSERDPEILKHVIRGISMITRRQHIDKIISFLSHPELKDHIIYAVSTMVRKDPKHISYIADLYYHAVDSDVKEVAVQVLSNRVDYYIMRLISKDNTRVKELLREIVMSGKTSDIIGFLNRNTNREIENEVLSILRPIIEEREDIKRELQIYLKERLLEKLKLQPPPAGGVKKSEKRERSKIVFLGVWLVCILGVFPVVFVFTHYGSFSSLGLVGGIKQYALDFNYYLVFYSIAINGIYLLLLIFSFIEVNRQARRWKLKKTAFLFKKDLLPSVSIIAPAYGEESTIIESTNSLLNLVYPDYELVVVNDGSPDSTLNVLIGYYQLEKVDVLIENKLETKPIRGIYINKKIPKLVVVDKANGGKADSLNAGINVSRKDFFCGIDADSLLEPKALLQLASLSLNTEKELVAAGGNIFPVNGCSVERGSLNTIGLPKNGLARFQTIEYIRAFMAGRLGWAFLRGLLIISGAFGLFSKERVIEAGGYLTSSGRYKKDTVGEDMELVVRLSRLMKEKKLPYSVQYAFNANCWTEVPETFSMLKKQRDRWHRGLLDILSFHRKLIANPRYGVIGSLAAPYFFIFEMLGPFVEIQGYLMVIIAAFTGMINGVLALLLFISTIVFGVFVSLSALFISEMEGSRFSLKDVALLILHAVLENFWFRQVMSFIRVTAYFNSLKKSQGWGKMVRKGFSSR